MEKQGRPDGKETHSAVMVFYERGNAGEVRFLAFQYTVLKNCNPWTTYKFPTETGLENETPEQTAISGAHQEIPENPNDFGFKFAEIEPIYVHECEGDLDKGGGVHKKYVFLMTDVRGELRKAPKVERGKSSRGDETLSPPKWFEASVLFELMEERGVMFHRIALLRALSRLATDHAVFDKYQALLSDQQYARFLIDA
jgi:hypothetical protein